MAATTEPTTHDELIDAGARIADVLYTVTTEESRAAAALGCAMFAAVLIVEQTPDHPLRIHPRELARVDIGRVQVFLDEVLKSIQALRIENPYARPH